MKNILIIVSLAAVLVTTTAVKAEEERAVTYEYGQVADISCSSDEYDTYATYDEAEAACSLDSGCVAIYDHACDADNFHLCPIGYEEKASDSGSCLYIKEEIVLCTGGTYDEMHTCCTDNGPCNLGEGDCDTDSDCAEDLVCGSEGGGVGENCGSAFLYDTAECCRAAEFYVAKGCPSTYPDEGISLQAASAEHAVRCCSDAGDLCVSDDNDVCFGMYMTNEDAKQICTDLGLRLCLYAELDICCGTGCCYDHVTTWIGDAVI